MTTLKGAGGINLASFETQSRKLTAEFESQDKMFKALRAGVQAPPDANVPGPGGKAPASSAASMISKEAGNAGSQIDWSRFEALRRASKADLDVAINKFRAIDRLDLDFQNVVKGLRYLGDGLDIEKLPDPDARAHYYARDQILVSISAVRRGLDAAGASPATAAFPMEQLNLLEKQIKEDMETLVRVKGEDVKKAPMRAGGGGWGYAPAKVDPSPDMLPATTALLAGDVKTIEAAAAALAQRLKAPGLANVLIEASRKVPLDSVDEFARYLGAYAILADEALHAPDYNKDPFASGPGDRQSYRARTASGWDAAKSGLRRESSRATLNAPLFELQHAKNPVASLEQSLIREFIREIGVPADAARAWEPQAKHVAAALEGEAFLPLRALNERGPYHAGKQHAWEWSQVVRSLSRSVVEGRFEEWRSSHEASAAQLALLDPDQKKIWLSNFSVDHEVKSIDGKPVTLKTSQPREFEFFWATKVGGPSHGFDTMTQCALPLLTNARDDAILVQDPRWPNFAGRTYLRLVQLANTGEPILFMESSHKDFPYPGSQLETEKALIKHAVAKGKEMKMPVVLSGRCKEAVESLGLKGEWRDESYLLAPSLLFEAASVFQCHDWVQKQPEVRRSSSPVQFFVDMKA